MSRGMSFTGIVGVTGTAMQGIAPLNPKPFFVEASRL